MKSSKTAYKYGFTKARKQLKALLLGKQDENFDNEPR